MADDKIVSVLLFLFAVGVSADSGIDPELLEKYEIAPPYFSSTLKVETYILPVLKYGMNLLEPYIDEKTVDNHLNGHHNAYRRNLNTVLTKWREQEPDNDFAKESIVTILQNVDKVPLEHRRAIVNNGGGFVNHGIYWAGMSPNLEQNATAREPQDSLLDDINNEFGSFADFKEQFSKTALSVFGSGYVWLVRKSAAPSRLFIETTANQDTPMSAGDFPILVIDVWEHAYYIKHQFRRVKHITDWWMVVDWESVHELDTFWKNGMKLSAKYYKSVKVEDEDMAKEEL